MMTDFCTHCRIFKSFLLPFLLRGVFGLFLFIPLIVVPPSLAENSRPLTIQDENHPHHSHTAGLVAGQWEGSPEGIAYSEFNHALAGLGIVLVGLSELRMGLGLKILTWSRWLLPLSLLATGMYVLIWSDHEAWPIGSWTLVETFSGKDPEVLQHKIFAILALGVGSIEWCIRHGTIQHRIWRAWLPGFAILGSFLLFSHMHGPHPAAQQIQFHHNVMGIMALAGGLAWFAGEWLVQPQTGSRMSSPKPSTLKIIWALLIILIGVQLMFYTES